jgi:hypothetical protein
MSRNSVINIFHIKPKILQIPLEDEVLAVVVMKVTIFWDIVTSILFLIRCFGGMYNFLQGKIRD